jgi:hypothetical protein
MVHVRVGSEVCWVATGSRFTWKLGRKSEVRKLTFSAGNGIYVNANDDYSFIYLL